jgi:site-specific recombinase XerD
MSSSTSHPMPPEPSNQGKGTSSTKGKKLLDLYREALRNRHYSYRTEQTYVSWVRQYILFHGKRHPVEMGEAEINAFITHLVNERNVAASTQNQAISAILFLYRHVLKIELEEKALIPIRPTKPKRVPTVLSKAEARRVIEQMNGVYRLMTELLYGSGLRLMEVLRLRVKDLDFDNRQTCAELVEASSSEMAKEKTTGLPSFPKACSSPSVSS